MKQYKKVLLGQHDGENIYLSPPSWDCGWYWGFGYLGNENCHYHVDGLTKHETYNHEKNAGNINLQTCLMALNCILAIP